MELTPTRPQWAIPTPPSPARDGATLTLSFEDRQR